MCRLIVPQDAFIDALDRMIRAIRSGTYDKSPEPYMGCLIFRVSGTALAAQDSLLKCGGNPW